MLRNLKNHGSICPSKGGIFTHPPMPGLVHIVKIVYKSNYLEDRDEVTSKLKEKT